MSQFDNVSVVKKAKVYFDGKCVSHTVTLADGTTYQLPKDFKAEGLKPGEKVKITWELKGKAHEASAMTAG